MSHDQRPGRLRVVNNPTPTGRRGAAASSSAVAKSSGGNSTDAVSHSEKAAARAPAKLPLGLAGLFLLACAVGGALVALVRPF